MTKAAQPSVEEGILWELENLCPCGSGELFKDCCNRQREFKRFEGQS